MMNDLVTDIPGRYKFPVFWWFEVYKLCTREFKRKSFVSNELHTHASDSESALSNLTYICGQCVIFIVMICLLCDACTLDGEYYK